MFNARNYAHALGVTGFSVALFASAIAPATAADAANTGSEVPTEAITTTQDLAPKPVTITLFYQGRESDYATEAKTFGELLTERGITVGPDDYLSADRNAALVDGMKFAYRPAVRITVVLGKRKVSLHTAAPTISDALAAARIVLGPRDAVLPDRRSSIQPGEIVRVTLVDEWTVRTQRTMPGRTIVRRDPHLAMGKTRIVSRGVTGIREITMRYTRRGDAPLRKRVISSRIIRHARPQIVAHGTMAVAPDAAPGFAGTELRSAMRLARNVLHVVATAYTAGCYKCSGITANGMHAGFGIIAVDPHIIPLGSKLMIPGYGRAIAGDTGGAIVGHRVDLGMNTLADALRFGRRSMTVYVLK